MKRVDTRISSPHDGIVRFNEDFIRKLITEFTM